MLRDYLPLLLPLAMALLRLVTGKYVFSALVSLSCALIAVAGGPALRPGGGGLP